MRLVFPRFYLLDEHFPPIPPTSQTRNQSSAVPRPMEPTAEYNAPVNGDEGFTDTLVSPRHNIAVRNVSLSPVP